MHPAGYIGPWYDTSNGIMFLRIRTKRYQNTMSMPYQAINTAAYWVRNELGFQLASQTIVSALLYLMDGNHKEYHDFPCYCIIDLIHPQNIQISEEVLKAIQVKFVRYV